MPVVRALADRAIALDESWGKGALHEMFISLDSLAEGWAGRRSARGRTLQARGRAAGRLVARALTSRWRLGVAVPAQDRAEFESLLKQALEIDPEKDPSTRLVTLVQQRRARALLDQIETQFPK